MNTFLTSNDLSMRLLRTIVQGLISVLIVYADALIGKLIIPEDVKPFLVAVIMAILSPIMSVLGGDEENEENN